MQDAPGTIPHPRCEREGLSGHTELIAGDAPQSPPESDPFPWPCCSRAGAVLDGREQSAPGLMRGDALAAASPGGEPLSPLEGSTAGRARRMAARLFSPAAFHIPWGFFFCP